MALLQRAAHKLLKEGPPAKEAGLSLPFALVIGFGIILGVTAVAGRANFGMLAASFNQDSKRAREAAETGITRIISELNREHNRPLLAINPASGNLWASADTSGITSACASRMVRPLNAPNLSQVNTGGADGATTAATVVYINDSGAATAGIGTTPATPPPSNTALAYKLNSVKVGTTPSWSGSTANRGTITLSITGYAYTAGKIASAVTVEQTFETVPKCCDLSLGGNNNSNLGNDLRSCNWRLGPAYGFIFSTALTDDGSTVFTGVNSELGIQGQAGNVESVVCLRSSSSGCPESVRIGNVNNTVPVNAVDARLNPPPEAPGSIANNTGTCSFAHTGNNPGTGCASLATTFIAASKTWVIDATLSHSLPSYCTKSTIDSVTTTHCNMSKISIGSNTTLRILTSNTHRFKLYFPSESISGGSGGIIEASQGSLDHCTKSDSSNDCNATAASVNPLLRFQIFGCRQDEVPTKGCNGTNAGWANNQGPQVIKLRGNSAADAEPFFFYAPLAMIDINGGGGAGSQLNAMIWTNKFNGSGNVEIKIPGSGSGDILDQFLESSNDPGSTGSRPFVYELVARATRAFKILPGQ